MIVKTLFKKNQKKKNMEERYKRGLRIKELFEADLEKNLKASSLCVPNELFEFPEFTVPVIRKWLYDVKDEVYNDIETKKEVFGVGSLGSIWYDKTYTGSEGVPRRTRVALAGLQKFVDNKPIIVGFEITLDPSLEY